jgi:signal transduction histidine kinase
MFAAEGFAGIVSQRMGAEAIGLSAAWFSRLSELLPIDVNDVFPSDQILDHIPLLIEEIARYLHAPEDEEIVANAAVIDKARELGVLRHQQQASVHQLLREFELLGDVLEGFVAAEASRLPIAPPPAECFDVLRRLTRATRALMRTTVDTFIAEYTATLQERNERLKTFNRMASHELRTPLGTLLFAAAALDQPSVRTDPERLSRVTEAIRGNTQRLARLVENLQRIVRLAESPDAPNVQEIDVATLAADIRAQIEDMAAARGVDIRVAPDLPKLFIDPARLELVLINLVSNAIKYSDPAKPDQFVEIGTDTGDETPGTVTIVVRDNGLGVPDEQQQAIFERFTRAHAHLDDEHGISGSGLGLAIVAECVEAIGGDIRCASVVGEGTTFFVKLPIEPSAAEPPAKPAF